MNSEEIATEKHSYHSNVTESHRLWEMHRGQDTHRRIEVSIDYSGFLREPRMYELPYWMYKNQSSFMNCNKQNVIMIFTFVKKQLSYNHEPFGRSNIEITS